MHLPSGGKLLGFVGFLLLAGLWTMVHNLFGQTEGFRFWGLGLLVVSVVFTVQRTIPVTLGNKELRPLEGWRKAYVLGPTYLIGVAVSLWPHEIACAINVRGYVCA
jgi:hypothetical protein